MSTPRYSDPLNSASVRCEGSVSKPKGSTPRIHTPRISETPSTQRRDSGNGGGGDGGSNLIVSRGLYEVLEKERQEHARTNSPQGSPRLKGAMSRPNFLFCYLCGQQFGSTSLAFHQPQCYVKKMIEWERMDPIKRGPKPLDPAEHEKRMKEQSTFPGHKNTKSSGKMNLKDVDRFNDLQIQHFNNNMLLKCDNCGRTFLPDRLEIHQRSCKAGSAGASKPVNRGSKHAMPCGRSCTASLSSMDTKKTISLLKRAASSEDVPLDVRSFSVGNTNSWPAATSVRDSTQSSATSPVVERDPLAETKPGSDHSDFLPDGADASCPAKAMNTSPLDVEIEVVSVEAVDAPPSVSSSKAKSLSVDRSPKCTDVSHESRVCSGSATGLSIAISSDGKRRVEKSAGKALDEKSLNDGTSAADETSDVEVQEPLVHEHKIQLNNVSRFKNVQSRIKIDRQKPADELPRCRYCNRTFNRERLEKHEDVCLERNKPPQTQPPPQASTAPSVKSPTVSSSRKAMAPRPETAAKKRPAVIVEERRKSASVTIQDTNEIKVASKTKDEKKISSESKPPSVERSGSLEEGVKLHFCFQCGAKLRPDGQRFCSDCGTKLVLQ